jgi:hypothetical protein
MNVDMTNNRVPYGLLTDEEAIALREHEKAGGEFECYCFGDWSKCGPLWSNEGIYRTLPLPEKTQDVTGYEKGLNDALACIASLGYGRSYDVDHGHDEAFRAVAKYRDDWKAGATKKTQDVIAWEKLPDWVEWVARDADFDVLGRSLEPYIKNQDKIWFSYGRRVRIDDFPGIVSLGTCDWKDSKQRRPRG